MTRAQRALNFIQRLTLTGDFQGQRITLYPFQRDIIERLYATDANGKTIVRKCLLMLPRKTSGKTTLAACLATEHIYQPKRGLLCVCASTDRSSANVLFLMVVSMIEASPYLLSKCRRLNRSTKTIELKNGNTLQIKSSEGKRAHSTGPSMCILDEMWTYKDDTLYAGMTSGMGTRQEPLTLMLSTQGNRKDTFLYREYELACKIRDGKVIDEKYLPIIYEATKDDDFKQEETWHKASPGLRYFGNIENIRDEFRSACEIPSKESIFRQFHLNQLIADSNKWLQSAKWKACGEHKVDPTKWGKRPTWFGCDLSNTSDATALVGICRFEDGHYEVYPHFWIPRKYADSRDAKGQTTYRQWADQGIVEYTTGDEIDYPYLEKRIPEILQPFKVRKILVDPFNATSTTQRLAGMGLPVVKHRQGWQSMSDPIKYTDVLISKGELHHGNNECLNWMAENVVVHRDRLDNLTFDKLRSADKIDGVVSMVCAIAGAMMDQKKFSVYNSMTVDQLMGLETNPDLHT